MTDLLRKRYFGQPIRSIFSNMNCSYTPNIKAFSVANRRVRSSGRSVAQTPRLVSDSPFDRPLVDPNYLSDPCDLELYIDFVRFQYQMAEHPVFEKVRAEIPGPGKQREQIVSDARDNLSTTWYQTSTCRMGIEPASVVGPDLKVHGLDNLRIVDASVFPTMTSGNTNAPTMMVAEKGSDLALGYA